MFNFGKQKKFLGIDVGTNSIKLVELGGHGRSLTLDNYAEVKTALTVKEPFKVFDKNSLFADQTISSAIAEVCSDAGIKTTDVAFSIPDFCSFFTNLEIPLMDEEEVPEAVKYEVRPFIPLPLSEITLDWLIIEGQLSKTPLKLLVVAIPNWIIEQYQSIARAASLRLKFIEPEAFALARAVARSEPEKIVGIVDIGSRSSSCGVIEKGILKTSYSFNTAGNELTERLARSLSIDYNAAEQMKNTYGLLADGQSKKDTRSVLIPLVDTILEEIKKIFRKFYQNEGKEVERVVLSGGQVFMPGLKEYFFVELKKEIIIADPFATLSFPQSLKGTLQKKGPTFAVSIGLAAKGLE